MATSPFLLCQCLCPRHEMAGAYSVTHFRHSLLPSFRIQFPLIFSVIHWDFQMKFGILVLLENTKVEFDIVAGRIIVGRVMPLGLRKISIIFSFRSLSTLQIDILNWNLVHENTQVEFDNGADRIIFGREMPLGLKKIPLIFSFRLLTFWIEICFIDVSWEYAGWVRIWIRRNNFRQSCAPWT